jgi:hypothetical protein
MSQLESKLCDSSPNSITFTTLWFLSNFDMYSYDSSLSSIACYYIVFLSNVYMYSNLNGEGKDQSEITLNTLYIVHT